MTNTYLTGNTLGSTSPKDLIDNSSNFDEAMNSPGPSFKDRFNKRRQSWAGMETAFQNFLRGIGFSYAGEYTTGLVLTSRLQYFVREGMEYRLSSSTDLPYTTSGDWSSEVNNFELIDRDFKVPIVSVTDFGEVTGDFVTDASPMWQAAFDSLVATGGGSIFAPDGDWLLNSPVTFPEGLNCNLRGSGKETCRLRVNNTVGGVFYDGGATVQGEFSAMLGLYDFSVISNIQGVSNGHAIHAEWTAGPYNSSTPHLTIQNVVVRCKGDSADDYFANCFYTRNAATVKISDCSLNQLGADCIHWNIDNSKDYPCYAYYLHNTDINHGTEGIRVRGWLEDLNITGCPINGQTINVSWVAEGIAGLAKVPNLHIQPGTVMNAKEYNVYAVNVDNVFLNGVDCYHGVGGAVDINGGNILVNNCSRLVVANCKLQSPRGQPGVTSENLVNLYNVTDFLITGNIFQDFLNSGVLIGDGCRNGQVSNNQVYTSPGADQFVFLQTGTAGDSGIVVRDNNVAGTMDQLVFNAGSGGVDVIGNTGPAGVPTYARTGTIPTEPCRIISNFPPQGRKLLSGVNPSVAEVPNGLIIFNDASSVNTTDLTGGYDGQQLYIYHNSGLRTWTPSASLRLQSGSAWNATAGSSLYLTRIDGVWEETGRRG